MQEAILAPGLDEVRQGHPSLHVAPHRPGLVLLHLQPDAGVELPLGPSGREAGGDLPGLGAAVDLVERCAETDFGLIGQFLRQRGGGRDGVAWQRGLSSRRVCVGCRKPEGGG